MEKYLVKIIKKDIKSPYYSEVEYNSPIAVLAEDLELPNTMETVTEKRYRMEIIKNHLDELYGCYVDDESLEFLKKIMNISNDNIKTVIDKKLDKIREEFQLKYDMREQNKERILDEVRNSAWYKRLFKMF